MSSTAKKKTKSSYRKSKQATRRKNLLGNAEKIKREVKSQKGIDLVEIREGVNITTNSIPNFPDLSYNITFTPSGESIQFTRTVNTTLVNNAIAAPTTFDMSGLK